MPGGAPIDRVEQINQHVGSLIDLLQDDERAIRALTARRASSIDQIRRLTLERNRLTVAVGRRDGWDFADAAVKETAAEIRHALLISSKAAYTLISESESLIHDLPDTLTALATGQISHPHAAVIAKESWFLPDECLPAFEQAAIPEAQTKILPRFRDRVKVIRERIHPVPLEVRHQRALKERNVWVDNGPDGMATLTYTDSAEKVIPIYNRIDKTARALRGPDEERTLPQLRADALGDLGLHGTPSPQYDRGVQPTVLIAVPALTAMGEGSEPAMMDGYGPIDPDTARRLAAKAPSFFRILTHPETGAILSLGRTVYKVPADMRRFLQLRDGTCRAFGCFNRADQCDIDHTIEWQHGGETDVENLAHLCRSHHQFKAYSAWTVDQIGGGRLKWTSPSGKTYITEPNSFIGPMPFTMPTTAPDTPPDLLVPADLLDQAHHDAYEDSDNDSSDGPLDDPSEPDPQTWTIPDDPNPASAQWWQPPEPTNPPDDAQPPG